MGHPGPWRQEGRVISPQCGGRTARARAPDLPAQTDVRMWPTIVCKCCAHMRACVPACLCVHEKPCAHMHCHGSHACPRRAPHTAHGCSTSRAASLGSALRAPAVLVLGAGSPSLSSLQRTELCPICTRSQPPRSPCREGPSVPRGSLQARRFSLAHTPAQPAPPQAPPPAAPRPLSTSLCKGVPPRPFHHHSHFTPQLLPHSLLLQHISNLICLFSVD